MNNTASRIIRSEEITIDMRICTILAGGKKPGEVYFAAIAPDMELTVITLDEVPDILPCFDESDVSINLPAHLQSGTGVKAGGQTLPDWPGHSGAHQHGQRFYFAHHRRCVPFPEVSGKPQRHAHGRQSQAALHLYGLRRAYA